MRPTQVLQKAYRKYRLTTKDINKNFYRGNRTGRMGQHTKYGSYRIDWNLVRTYVVPTSMEGFKLTPFVTNKVERTNGQYDDKLGPKNPVRYLERWKKENGFD